MPIKKGGEQGSGYVPSINRVVLLGNLGRDPEVRSREDGRRMATLSLATAHSWRDRDTGEWRKRTDWHQVVVYNEPLVDLAEQSVHKGSRLYVEGQLFNRTWKDQKGQERKSTEVVLSPTNGVMILWDAKKDAPKPSSEPPPTSY